jgi:hypothetical protein
MKIFSFLSRFLFERSMNTFDVFCIMTISSLIARTESWLWLLLFIATIPISSMCQVIVENQQEMK